MTITTMTFGTVPQIILALVILATGVAVGVRALEWVHEGNVYIPDSIRNGSLMFAVGYIVVVASIPFDAFPLYIGGVIICLMGILQMASNFYADVLVTG